MMDGIKDYWQILCSLIGLVAWGTRLEGKVQANRELQTQALDNIEKKVDKLDRRMEDIADFLIRTRLNIPGSSHESAIK